LEFVERNREGNHLPFSSALIKNTLALITRRKMDGRREESLNTTSQTTAKQDQNIKQIEVAMR
jgi:hypothetical protein